MYALVGNIQGRVGLTSQIGVSHRIAAHTPGCRPTIAPWDKLGVIREETLAGPSGTGTPPLVVVGRGAARVAPLSGRQLVLSGEYHLFVPVW